MAGKRQPVNLLLFKGKKHLTKKEIAERQKAEVKAAADNVKPPSYLPKKLQEEFKQIANELLRIELITNLDVDALARFLLAREQYVRLSKALRSTPATQRIKDDNGKTHTLANETYSDILLSVDKTFKQCRQAAADLGLTISSRCRLVVPKAPENPQPTEFEQRFGEV